MERARPTETKQTLCQTYKINLVVGGEGGNATQPDRVLHPILLYVAPQQIDCH